MAQDRRYKAGDIVKLKSGGPEMTVKNYYSLPLGSLGLDLDSREGQVICQWFAGNKLQEGDFQETSLELVKETEDET